MQNKNIVYCTYFDKGFLLKGLSLYESMNRYEPKANLWILAFDNYTAKVLKKMKLKGVTVISLKEFEDKDLLSVKPTRNPVEYYWTCTPKWVQYVMKKSKAKYTTYLDADLYFYSEPSKTLDEIKDKSILAVEHRFPKGREGMAKTSGRFNVAVNVFKNDKVGKKCLERWSKQCLEWCYWRLEDGKLGDQMYLDEWPKLYGKDLVISQNKGIDLAPWNVSQYKTSSKGEEVYVDKDKLICYHFHQFQILGPDHFSRVLGYTLSKDIVKLIYEPYEDELRRQHKVVKKFDKDYKISHIDTKQDKIMLLKQKLARHIGPFYWRIKNVLKWQRS